MKNTEPSAPHPFRGSFGARRPPALDRLALPPRPMPARDGLRPLKAWRYVGVFGPELMLCVATVRIGPARQGFWAVWDRAARRLHQRTDFARPTSSLQRGRLQIRDREIQLELELAEGAGVETVCPAADSYAWTRKQGAVPARGTIVLGGESRAVDARAVIDDTAGYYPRHTCWRWCAGVGVAADGRALGWNLVEGVNDPPVQSERTVWADGNPAEVPPCRFAADLSSVDNLRFHAEAVRERNDNLLLLRSRYRQPFGTFSGVLPGGIELTEGYGVMEDHEAWW